MCGSGMNSACNSGMPATDVSVRAQANVAFPEVSQRRLLDGLGCGLQQGREARHIGHSIARGQLGPQAVAVAVGIGGPLRGSTFGLELDDQIAIAIVGLIPVDPFVGKPTIAFELGDGRDLT